MSDSAGELLAQVNKRLTLNLLIQGSAQHAFVTSHHLIRDELNAINADLLPLYDKLAIAGFAQYWYSSGVLVTGHPAIFWRRATRFLHPFSRHPLLARHGLKLATAAQQRARERCREKGVTRLPLVFDFYIMYLLNRIGCKEAAHTSTLTALARRVTQEIWGIPQERLDARICLRVSFGRTRLPTTPAAVALRAGAAGYGGVLLEGSQLQVVARARNWPILSHELVKGTAELICLHGLNSMDETLCKRVLRAADRIEYEPWMLQTGSELWRQLLVLLPAERPLAQSLMHIARLSPEALQSLMLAAIEDPPWARELLAQIDQTG